MCVSGVPLCVAPFVWPCTTATLSARQQQQRQQQQQHTIATAISERAAAATSVRSRFLHQLLSGPYRNIQQMFSMFHCGKYFLFFP